ncbi:unnamed protein product [Soboliphyme baturini]|uniref:HIT domain-containing protein n=1 Tax=Soboliphyme baturini TaxID=241478 RepID=A0A183J5Z4_9BILA|nr:unnamed protein product [Soboliphyme baturini]
MFRAVQKVQKVLEKYYKVSSSSVVIQDGPHAGQTVRHVHVHILPRRPNDFPNNDEIYSEVSNHWLEKHDKKDSKEQWRELGDMSSEAAVYRRLINEYKDV